MASIDKIKPGQILHDYHKYKMGSTTMTTEGHWPVEVVEVDLINRRALCYWNSRFNKPEWYYERRLKRLKVNPKKAKNV